MIRSYKNHSSGFYEGNPNNDEMSSSTSSEYRSPRQQNPPPPLISEVVTIDSDSDDNEQVYSYNNNNEESSPDRHHRPESDDTEKRESDDDVIVIDDESESIEKLSWIKSKFKLDPRDKVKASNFEFLKLLGTGAYGSVYLVRKQDGIDKGELYAMKVLEKVKVMQKKKTTEHTRTEREVLEQIVDCPFLATMYYAFQTPEKLYLVLAFVQGGELFTHLFNSDSFTENRTRFYIAEIIIALEQLHQLSVIYRDIKLENILLDADGHIVITDFGLSKKLIGNDRAHSYCGTIEYMAPEIVSQEDEGHDLNVDWWSVGVLTIELLTGQSPFSQEGEDSNQSLISKRIKEEAPNIPESIGESARDFILKLLEKDPKKRLGSIGDAVALKNHRFFKSINWQLLKNKAIDAPNVPVVNGADDVSQFADDFTKQEAVDKPAERPTQKNAANYFKGYSYVAPQFRRQYAEPEEDKAPVVDRVDIELLKKILKSQKQNGGEFFRKYYINPDDLPIGDGTYSICIRCTSIKSGTEFAVKIMNLVVDPAPEINALTKCQGHKNIVNLVESLEDKHYKYIVFELLDGGELFSRIREHSHFKEHVARAYFEQLLQAVKFMHSQGIVHRDLKPENIIFTRDFVPKIIDFGFARSRTSKETVPCFTLDYAPPESLTKGTIEESRDMWSLGAILYTMLCGTTPFTTPNNKRNEVKEKIKLGRFNTSGPWKNLSREAKNLISQLLQVNPDDRMTLEQVEEDAWLKKQDFSDIEPIVIDDESMDAPPTKNREENVSNDSSGIVLSDENVCSSSVSSNVDNPSEEAEQEPEPLTDSEEESNIAEENTDIDSRHDSEQVSELMENVSVREIPEYLVQDEHPEQEKIESLEGETTQNLDQLELVQQKATVSWPKHVPDDKLPLEDDVTTEEEGVLELRKPNFTVHKEDSELSSCSKSEMQIFEYGHQLKYVPQTDSNVKEKVTLRPKRDRKPRQNAEKQAAVSSKTAIYERVENKLPLESEKASEIEEASTIHQPQLPGRSKQVKKKRGRQRKHVEKSEAVVPEVNSFSLESPTYAEIVPEPLPQIFEKKTRRGRQQKSNKTHPTQDISEISVPEITFEKKQRRKPKSQKIIAEMDQNGFARESDNMELVSSILPQSANLIQKTHADEITCFNEVEHLKPFNGFSSDKSSEICLGFPNVLQSWKFILQCLPNQTSLSRITLRARKPGIDYRSTTKRIVQSRSTNAGNDRSQQPPTKKAKTPKIEKTAVKPVEIREKLSRVAKRKADVPIVQPAPKRKRRRRSEIDGKEQLVTKVAVNPLSYMVVKPEPTLRKVVIEVTPEYLSTIPLQQQVDNNLRPSMIQERRQYLP